MRILILGGTGMLGFQVFKTCIDRKLDVAVVARNKDFLIERFGKKSVKDLIYTISDINDLKSLREIVDKVRPIYIINCIGIVKQSNLSNDYIESIKINSLFPHQLNSICSEFGCNMIHISTDCVFDGVKGMYSETDQPNATDVYGKTKHLGEVAYGNGVTLRTSIIGHEESQNKHGLLEWYLKQSGEVKGYTKAIFSGFTTLELTKLILEFVIPQNLISGIYQVASKPISKYELLGIISSEYNIKNTIVVSEEVVINRSLNGSRFSSLTGYQTPTWPDMVREMKADKDFF